MSQIGLFDHRPAPEAYRDWRPKPLPSLDGVDEIALDFETTGLRWWEDDLPIGAALRLPDGTCQYIPWGHLAGGNHDEATVKHWFEREVRGKRIINLNTKFDIHMAFAWGIDLEVQGNTVSDVAHYAGLLDDHRRKFSLEQLGQDMLGVGKKGDGIDKTRMASYHAGEVAEYAEQDVWLVGELRNLMWPQLDEEELQGVRQLEDSVIFPVCEMERNGAVMDLDKLHTWRLEAEQLRLKCIMDVYRMTGLRVNPDAHTDWVALFKNRGIEFSAYTESGKPSFTEAVVKQIADEAIQLTRKGGKYSDLLSKYLVKYSNSLDSHGILRYALHQMRADEGGTVTGRFSSSKLVDGVGANIQQVLDPEKQAAAYGDEFIIRELFIPKEGLFLSADAKQIEYRLFAHYANSAKINAAYADNPDLSFHNTVWEMLKVYKSDLPYKHLKNINFCKIYGGGLIKMAQMLEFITEAEGTAIRNECRSTKMPHWRHPKLAKANEIDRIYAEQIPEVGPLLKRAAEQAEKRGYVKTLAGRRARFKDGAFSHAAFNRVAQGGAADLMKMKLCELFAERKQLGITLRMTVHDEVVCDVPDVESARMVEEVLNRQSVELRVPILWSVKTGKNWADCD